jgi:hypothetical protein
MVRDWAFRATSRLRADDPERGDVPGWVLITIMSAGIVTVLWSFAGDALRGILSDALDSVTGPGGGGG